MTEERPASRKELILQAIRRMPDEATYMDAIARLVLLANIQRDIDETLKTQPESYKPAP
jgi:hypothetical protein